ncbi:hypothetical protein Hanom_Chr15g01394881 [Helianthus anomalus]
MISLDTVMFKSLCRLVLTCVPINDEVLKYITTSCPLLQVFAVNACHGLKRFCEFAEVEKLKEIKLPPYELDLVELQLETHEESQAHIAFVDVVLWCCRPRTLTLRSFSPLTALEEHSDVVKFTYKKLLAQEDRGPTNIQIVSPSFSSLLMVLPHVGKAISFIKEKGTLFINYIYQRKMKVASKD